MFQTAMRCMRSARPIPIGLAAVFFGGYMALSISLEAQASMPVALTLGLVVFVLAGFISGVLATSIVYSTVWALEATYDYCRQAFGQVSERTANTGLALVLGTSFANGISFIHYMLHSSNYLAPGFMDYVALIVVASVFMAMTLYLECLLIAVAVWLARWSRPGMQPLPAEVRHDR